MKPNFEKLIKKAGHQETLSAAERDKMRYVLTEYMAFKPVAVSPAPESFYQKLLNAIVPSIQRPVGISLAGVVVVVLAFGGIAYAAEDTLPGDALYPVKVGVLEPIGTALTFSPAAKVQRHTTLAERRIDEAGILASEGKLSSTTETALVANFSANATLATQAIKEQETSDPLDAAVSATNFSAQLGGYESILSQVDSRHHSDTRIFQGAIRAQIALSDQTAVSNEPSSSSTDRFRKNSSATSAYLTGMQQETTDALHTSSGLLNSLTSSSSVNARGQFDNAAQSAAQGTELFNRHDNNGAFRAYQNSLSDTSRLDVLTRTSATLDLNTFASTSATSTVTTSSSNESSNPPSAPKEDHSSKGDSTVTNSTPPTTPSTPLPLGL